MIQKLISSAFLCITVFTIPVLIQPLSAQEIIMGTSKGLSLESYTDEVQSRIQIQEGTPLFSFLINEQKINSLQADIEVREGVYELTFGDTLYCEVIQASDFGKGWKAFLKITNRTKDTIGIENIVPFGESPGHVHITSTGPWALARAKLFLPGHGPVGVILPDNAWELGYAQIPLDGSRSLCALTRRTSVEKGEKRRYKTIVYPGGTVEYVYYVDDFKGDWQEGLRLMFQERYLYDLEEFDNTLFEREDLEWIRNDYMIGLQFAWNKDYFDWQHQVYRYFRYLEEGMYYFGGYDVFGLWPTWPRLGVDERNQWDLFSDLPGGLQQIRYFSQQGKQMGTKFFICYNPWDESTRKQNPYIGMATLIDALDADGVVLDCHGWSSAEYQKAADSIKPGVVMYSEGMAVVKDMPGIVSGRVHNAIFLSPPLNLNKLIKPDFAIFRVCQGNDERIHREVAIAFFNGYGTEINTFAPGEHTSLEQDLFYLGRTTMTLRENSSNFLAYDWTPLEASVKDSIWVNRWPKGDKTLFTVFSLVPEGFRGPLIGQAIPEGYHAVSLWHHEEISPDTVDGNVYLPVKLEAFNRYDLGTRAEGNVDCLAILPALLHSELKEGRLEISAMDGDEIRIWAGMPSYQNTMMVKVRPGEHELNLMEIFGDHEGKIVAQLLSAGELLDENVLYLEPGSPRLMAGAKKTRIYASPPAGMVRVPAGRFRFEAANTDRFIPYPDPRGVTMEMKAFYMDRYPVTNADFLEFLQATGYTPRDTANFLRHWTKGNIPKGQEDHPVVYIDINDAQAYASWAGKRLPTEAEWQYAGMGEEELKWPWGNDMDSTLCNYASGATTPVNAYPGGISPFGVMDMVGNVWQLTSDVYDNGTYYFVIMKGGSFYRPTSSWWYVKGGPQPLDWHQQLLLVAPGFDRNSTVGFRCAADAVE